MNISDLPTILHKTLADMENLSANHRLDHPEEMYWLTPIGEKFNMTSRPASYEVGNLREEFDSVMSRIEAGDVIYPDSLLLISTLARLAYELSGRSS